MKQLRSALCVLSLLCLSAVLLCAQEITGDIRGIVNDPSGAAVAGATVEVTNTDRNAVIRTVKSDASGNFVAAYLPIGHYKVSVKVQGFRDFEANNIVLNVHDRLTVDAHLQVGGAAQTVSVNEAPTQIDLDNATASGLMTGNQVRQLTLVTRNYEQLVAALPGVSTNLASDQLFVGVSNPVGSSNQINFSINGSRPTQNNWQIDGSDNVDRGANLTLLAYPSVDSIAEFNVLRSNYLPENGRSSGGEINVMTRGGTSQFHGDAYEFFRNDVFNANNYFNNRTTPITPRPEMRWNDFGFTVGGPVYIPGLYNKDKNKTFFFYSQEWRKIITYATQTSSPLPTPPELAGTFPDPVCIAIDGQRQLHRHRQPGYEHQSDGRCVCEGHLQQDPGAQQSLTEHSPGRDATSSTIAKRTCASTTTSTRRSASSDGSLTTRYRRWNPAACSPPSAFRELPRPAPTLRAAISPFHGTVTFSPTLLADMGYAYSYGAVISRPSGLELSANSPDVQPTLPFGLASEPAQPELQRDPGHGRFRTLQRLQPQSQCVLQPDEGARQAFAEVRRQLQLLHQGRKR